MTRTIIDYTSTASWKTLVSEASRACQIELSEDLESYLVFMLMRYTESPEVANSILALDYLSSMDKLGHQQVASLRDVGDLCLLHSGLFPGRASRRKVRISYYVDLGKTAYLKISEQGSNGISELYYELSENFVPMMDTLHAMHEVENHSIFLDPLQAEELWTDTKSKHAKQTLEMFTNIIPMPKNH